MLKENYFLTFSFIMKNMKKINQTQLKLVRILCIFKVFNLDIEELSEINLK